MSINYKQFLVFLLFIAFTLISFSMISAANTVSSCQPIFLSGEYVLADDIVSGDDLIDCILVMVDDVTLDCNDFSLTGENVINGIVLNYTTNVTIKNCIVNDLDYGILIKEGSDNVLLDNILDSNVYGIRIQNSSNNLITGNLINQNDESGILIVSSSDNEIYNNFFVNTRNFQITSSSGLNFWNNSLGGNYWALPDDTGYSISCLDEDNDDICDSNYSLYNNNVDYLPLKNCLICPEESVEIGSSRSETSDESVNYSVNQTQLKAGHNNVYSLGDRLHMNIKGEDHVMAINKIRSELIEINVSPTLQQAILFVGETKKFSLVSGFYDLAITLNNIEGSGDTAKANITVIEINESISMQENESDILTCNENWLCEDWEKCSDNFEVRTCVDLNNCGTEENKPLTEQACERSVRWIMEIVYIFIGLAIILLIIFLIRWGGLK